MSNFAAGRRAEAASAAFLEVHGYQIVAQNWRTRWCEIDIVAKRRRTLYFCEVKYRRGAWQGSGLDYITPKKLQQMRFAAESWVHMHAWRGDYQLLAIELSGPSFEITALIEIE